MPEPVPTVVVVVGAKDGTDLHFEGEVFELVLPNQVEFVLCPR